MLLETSRHVIESSYHVLAKADAPSLGGACTSNIVCRVISPFTEFLLWRPAGRHPTLGIRLARRGPKT